MNIGGVRTCRQSSYHSWLKGTHTYESIHYVHDIIFRIIKTYLNSNLSLAKKFQTRWHCRKFQKPMTIKDGTFNINYKIYILLYPLPTTHICIHFPILTCKRSKNPFSCHIFLLYSCLLYYNLFVLIRPLYLRKHLYDVYCTTKNN